ncbi:MAG: hypothetical protein A3F54_05710 [Candidatus Kerfeldbacteria bacterium RIFCSPHIGHO2_12_FULL_48_17]|uniref:F0F1-ATPase subunit n=1 Tax=Candidatus Kerfeldbacteria bacterium RIFCSPHIGHO2_12_FULL_48_17 TaxID=1798542 RepID=A0A1G2B5U3_9BACT|nr:MAG: hypothetical protein A3F54_05710 [Candidatus Kerfeldbacteria bacterium RIFCSPHIGHO2_12_FULL_48_17]
MKSSWKYLNLVGQIGLIIAIPVVILTLTGRYLDNRFDTQPWFLLGGVILSFIISSLILWGEVIKTAKLLSEQTAEEEKDETKETSELASEKDAEETKKSIDWDDLGDLDDEDE